MITADLLNRLLRAQRAGRLICWIDQGVIRLACVTDPAGITDTSWRDALRRRLPYSEKAAARLLDRLGVI